MAVLKPRERLVYFRISEDEFHQFLSLCEQEGARSVSDLARNAVQRLIAGCNRQREDEDLAPKIQLLERLIAEVSSQLEFLATLKARNSGISEIGNDGLRPSSDATSSDDHRRTEGLGYGNPA